MHEEQEKRVVEAPAGARVWLGLTDTVVSCAAGAGGKEVDGVEALAEVVSTAVEDDSET